MCGILCFINDGSLEEAELARLQHRGPDNQTLWSKKNNFLGHARLSIVDLSTCANQPFHNESGTVHLICNGEIYNAPDLRKVLEGKGHEFVSRSDNEVILHGYEEWGYEIVDKLRGMFAFIIYDEGEEAVFAARDHVGIKPLYYEPNSHQFRAASELNALTLDRSIEDVDTLSLCYYFFLGYVPSPYSILKGYKKLEPGHYLIWRKGSMPKTIKYWNPPEQIQYGNTDEFEELFHSVLDEHLLSDVPIGAFLSAGLDSTSIVAGLTFLGYETRALTIGFPEASNNEAPLARKVSDFLGVEHHTINICSSDVIELAQKMISMYDEPQGYGALMTMVQVCEAASGEFKVILSGDGGDEIFGGYTWYQDLFPNLIVRNKRSIKSLVKKLLGDSNALEALSFENKSALHRHVRRLFPRYLPDEINKLLAPLNVDFNEEIALAPLKKYFINDLPLQRALQRVDLMTFCADSINPKVDRASMAFSTEVRVPFLDKRLIEFGLQRPINDQMPKQVLRNYLKNRVPEEVFKQPKQGFSAQMMDEKTFAKIKESNYKNNELDFLDLEYVNTNDQHWAVYNMCNFFYLK